MRTAWMNTDHNLTLIAYSDAQNPALRHEKTGLSSGSYVAIARELIPNFSVQHSEAEYGPC